MAIAIPIEAEILQDGRVLRIRWEMDTPASWGVPDWLPGFQAGAKIKISTGAKITYMSTTTHSNVENLFGGSWNSSTFTYTLTGAFANYRTPTLPTDYVYISYGVGGDANISSKVSDDAITLTSGGLLAAASLNLNGLASETTYLFKQFAPGQGTKLVWESTWLMDSENDVIIWSDANLKLSADAGLLQDFTGNTSAAFDQFPVTNNSKVDRDGFTTKTGFTRGASGVTLYVAPGHPSASDTNTFSQAQSQSTPYATLLKAIDQLFSNSKAGTGSCIRLLQGTTHTSGTIQLRVSGAGPLQPTLIETYWDETAGVGQKNVRPIVYGNINTSQGGGSAVQINYICMRDINFIKNPGSSTGNFCYFYLAFKHVIIDNCIFDGHGGGFNFQRTQNNTATVGFFQNPTLLRCMIKNICTNDGSHSNSSYCDGTKNLLFSQCVFYNGGRVSSDYGFSDIFSHHLYLSHTQYHPIVWGCFLGRAGSHGTQMRAGGTIYRSVYFENGCLSFMGDDGGRFANCYLESGASIGENPVYEEINFTLTGCTSGSFLPLGSTAYYFTSVGGTSSSYSGRVLSTTGPDVGPTGSTVVWFDFTSPSYYSSGRYLSLSSTGNPRYLISSQSFSHPPAPGCNYDQSTQRLTFTGIGSNISQYQTLYSMTGTNVTPHRLYRVETIVDANTVALSYGGLGISATNCNFIIQNLPRCLGHQFNSANQSIMENCIGVDMTKFTTPNTSYPINTVNSGHTAYVYHYIIRNNTFVNSGPFTHDDVVLNYRLERYQNIIDNKSTTAACISHSINYSDWSNLISNNNICLGTSGSEFKIAGIFYPIATYRSTSSEDANSTTTGSINYNSRANLDSWAQLNGFADKFAYIDALTSRPYITSYASHDRIENVVNYFMNAYNANNVAFGNTGPYTYYGAGTTAHPKYVRNKLFKFNSTNVFLK